MNLDEYIRLDEGPWTSKEAAEDFARAEVGVQYTIIGGDGLWYIYVAEDETEEDDMQR